MEKLPKKSCKKSLFDTFLEEINKEELESDLSSNETSIEETIMMDVENSPINNQDTILNENNNCDIMLKAFDDAFETMYGNNEVSFIHIQKISEEFQANCIHMINTFKTQSESLEIEKSKYNLLENESATTINQLQLEVTKLNWQLKQLSSFSSIIGSTLCYYLWKATQISSVIDMILQKDNITSMAKFITNILSGFIKTYNKQMPSIKTNETQFVLLILRILANLTTTKSGCHFFSQVNDGINIINLIVSLVLCTPPSLDILKNTSYSILYNVSIQFNGYLLMKNIKLIQTLQNDIKEALTKNNNTILFSLNLLLSLTRKMDRSMYMIFKNEVSIMKLY
ncbi:uncharacterized protein LOC132932342 [Rhopalosiphum padi]|uniref:uncharacterized protein LOC132932342 n=1 Tax=Rhopalosiphum padi TaxID=40932 RepID=UPI00298D62FA|nr:uncharacterized protein LOC132932342 [Rhopalosiphum padi]